jgi:oligopeptidase B
MQQPPTARRAPVARIYHGDRFDDPYAWMSDRESPELLELLAAENGYATEQTEHLKPLAEQIFEEFRSRIEETDLSVPVRHDRWWYYSRTIEGEQYAVEGRVLLTDHSQRPALSDGRPPAGEEVLLDQNAEAVGHDFFGVGASEVSPAGDLLAYAVDLAGDERYDVRVRSIATGETLDEAVRETGGPLAWSLDGRHLFYTRVDDAWRPYQVWRHELGTPVDQDALVHEERDERFFVGVGSSRDERHIIIAISSKTTSEFRLLDATDPLGTPWIVAERRAGVEYDVEPIGDQILVTHNASRTNFELAIAPITCTSAQEWLPLDLTTEDEFVTGAEGFDDFIAISLRREGGTGVRIVLRDPEAPHGLGEAHDISVGEPIGTIHVGANPESSTATLQVVHESLVTPRTVEDYDVRARTFTLLKAQRVRDGHDLAQYRQRREWATAPDGTRVPISIVHRADVVADGTAPGLLHGYGAYGIPSDPWFSVLRLSLLQRGWVFAIAHVRGGSEMGRSWYDDGKLTAKPHTFTDFVACADHLRDTGIVASDRLAAEGGSAGGLLMGVIANQAPDRFRFIHASVPFVDALTTILDPSMPLTVIEWEEWGNPLEDPTAYALMKSYTPYENVIAQRYPVLLVTTSLHDTRVYVTEPAKWVAALRHETRDLKGAAQVIFRTEMAGGHGGQSGRYDTWRQWAWETSVLLGAMR